MAARDGTETTERHCGILSRVHVNKKCISEDGSRCFFAGLLAACLLSLVPKATLFLVLTTSPKDLIGPVTYWCCGLQSSLSLWDRILPRLASNLWSSCLSRHSAGSEILTSGPNSSKKCCSCILTTLLFSVSFFEYQVSFCSSRCLRMYYVVQAGLKQKQILLPQPPEYYWDYRSEPPYPACSSYFAHQV